MRRSPRSSPPPPRAWLARVPTPSNVLRAFRQPLADVRVLIVGQDPYPTPGHPIGLSFAVDRHVRPLPRSLGNIYTELEGECVRTVSLDHGALTAFRSKFPAHLDADEFEIR